MIYDSVANMPRYISIPKVDKILVFLKKNDCTKLPDGEIEIDGRNLYVKVLRYVPKIAEENNFETHKVYTDVQVMVDGSEKMQVTNRDKLSSICGYDKTKDFQFFRKDGAVSDIVVEKGEFTVFFPGDVHKPGCLHSEPGEMVLKLVFKTR